VEERTERPDVEQTLTRLGIEEIEERLEVSPLLLAAGGGDDIGRQEWNCCACKIPDPREEVPLPGNDPPSEPPMW
jgi:hypothetical protein